MPIRMDGKAMAGRVKNDLADRVRSLGERGVHPGLGTILVGEDPGSVRYVKGKHADCSEVGIESIRIDLPAQSTQDDVIAAVRTLNDDPRCTGFIVQLPLPDGIDETAVVDAIDPAKDADGMHPYNLGQLVSHVSGRIGTPLPCTPRAVMTLLDGYGIDVAGREVCVVGRGITIGRTMGLMLTRRGADATVTQCHTGTRDLRSHLRRADIIIAAAGHAGIVGPDDVSEGVVLVDVGVSRVYDDAVGRYRIKGDVDRRCYERSGAYTPNPGGVGPMTRAMLLSNVVEMAERSSAR